MILILNCFIIVHELCFVCKQFWSFDKSSNTLWYRVPNQTWAEFDCHRNFLLFSRLFLAKCEICSFSIADLPSLISGSIVFSISYFRRESNVLAKPFDRDYGCLDVYSLWLSVYSYTVWWYKNICCNMRHRKAEWMKKLMTCADRW